MLAQLAFLRQDRPDHASGMGFKGRKIPSRYTPLAILKSAPLSEDITYIYSRGEDLPFLGDHSYVTERDDHEEVSLTDPLDEYAAWLEEHGMVDTTSNLVNYFAGIQYGSKPNTDEEILHMNANELVYKHHGMLSVELREKFEDEDDDPYATRETIYGVHDLLAKLDGLRSSEARRAVTQATYDGDFRDDEPTDWHDGFTIR